MCQRLWISGKVQRVGYRDFAWRNATALGISGYARNLPDGRVEVLACGPAPALEQLQAKLREGPKWSVVQDIEHDTADCPARQGFVIA
jgi:acylphosphatase